MAPSSPSDTPNASQRCPMSEAEVIMRMLGNDPWMRYDLWASRAWESAEKASQMALTTAPPISSDDAVFDPRVAALFHAAEVAKEFAEMVNPLTAVGGVEFGYETDFVEQPEVIIAAVAETEETDTD